MNRDYIEDARIRVEALKEVNSVLKGSCAAQVVLRANSKEEAYDEVLKVLKHFRGLSKKAELSWEDVRRIVTIADDILPDPRYKQDLDATFQTEQSYYEEVLRRYMEVRT